MKKRIKIASVSEYLRDARVKSGLSQADLSEQLGYTSPQIVSNWERGLCGAPLDKLYDLSDILKLKRNELLDLLLSEQEALLRSKIHGQKKSKSKRA